MNSDTLAGEGRNLVGKAQEAIGDATGDRRLRTDGIGNQLSGNLQTMLGTARDTISAGVERLPAPARRFIRERPVASAAIAGVAGLFLLRMLRR